MRWAPLKSGKVPLPKSTPPAAISDIRRAAPWSRRKMWMFQLLVFQYQPLNGTMEASSTTSSPCQVLYIGFCLHNGGSGLLSVGFKSGADATCRSFFCELDLDP
eukprot:CAMPEP_0114654280 /NCGR_PEP_ID=MMETSP0191-20121206/10383_1 /TAXON_ID=126664 /ORGANISM="Sorites sp." /LENGTH=103 /DNA_ID=CAMNT_0001869731 /DNA_START=322 /DNA_END=629 /DNA_ORIENTATION=-